MPDSCSAIILAGGKSTRIGTDKACLRLSGLTPLINRVAERLRGLSNDVIVVTSGQKYPGLDVSWTSDVYADSGPLGGIHAGLLAARNQYALVVACDMPFLEPRLLEYMAGIPRTYDILVPRLKTGVEPLHAIYSKHCLPAIEKRLQRKCLPTLELLEDVDTWYLTEKTIRAIDPLLRSFYNVNSWENVRNAEMFEIEAK